MAKTTGLVRRALWIAGATALPWVVPAWGTAQGVPDAQACPDARTCVEVLEDGIDLVASGRWEGASVLLGTVAAGLAEYPEYERDLARAYLYLGVARLRLADPNETRQLFAEAQVRDPTLRLAEADFPQEVLAIWDEARDLGMLVVDTEPAGVEVSVDGAVLGRTPVRVAGLKPGQYRVTLAHDGYVGVSHDLALATGRTERLFVPLIPAPGVATERDAASTQARPPVDLPVTAERFSADTFKESGRSMWRTLAGVLGVAAGAAMMIESSKCTPGGGRFGNGRQGTPVEMLGGTVEILSFSSFRACRLEYGWTWRDSAGILIGGQVDDHELVKSGERGALGLHTPLSFLDPSIDPSMFEEQLPAALVQAAGDVRPMRHVPLEYLVGGLALAGVGTLLATIWSDVVEVEEVAVGIAPTGGVLVSRSFGW